MSTAPAIVALLATIAMGAVVGFHHLARARKAGLVRLHLALALLGTGLVGWMAVAAAGGAWPLGLLGLALALGYAAPRLWRRSSGGAQAALIGHVFVGVAGFLVLLSWAARQ